MLHMLIQKLPQHTYRRKIKCMRESNQIKWMLIVNELTGYRIESQLVSIQIHPSSLPLPLHISCLFPSSFFPFSMWYYFIPSSLWEFWKQYSDIDWLTYHHFYWPPLSHTEEFRIFFIPFRIKNACCYKL